MLRYRILLLTLLVQLHRIGGTAEVYPSLTPLFANSNSEYVNLYDTSTPLRVTHPNEDPLKFSSFLLNLLTDFCYNGRRKGK